MAKREPTPEEIKAFKELARAARKLQEAQRKAEAEHQRQAAIKLSILPMPKKGASNG